MPDLEKLFPGRFIKASEMDGKPTTLTIADVVPEKVDSQEPDAKGAKETMAVVYFAEIDRQWHLNRTNALCLAAMWGRDYTKWPGHKVTLVPEKDTSGLSDSGQCIRVKGSPELSSVIEASIKLPRRKPIKRKLFPTGTAPEQPPMDLEQLSDKEPCEQRSPDCCAECMAQETECTDPLGPDTEEGSDA